MTNPHDEIGEPWLNHKTMCGDCGHVWIATCPLSCDISKLQCSKCGKQNSLTFEETASEAVGELFNGHSLLSVEEGEREHMTCEINAETMEEIPGVTVFPLKLNFSNGKQLVLHISGWEVK